MTFDTDQRSVSDSAPVELYEFAVPQETLYRTTYQEDYSNSGNTYVACAGLRTEITVASPGEQRDIFVEIPTADDLVQNYVVGIPPVLAAQIVVTIYRLQQLSGARVIWWQGPVRGVSFKNNLRVARFRIPDGLEDALRTELPRARAQRKCNNALYDAQCQVLETDHDHSTTIANVDGSVIEVASVDTAELTYAGGQVEWNGERRGVVKEDLSALQLTLDAPFRGLTNGQTVTLFAGCQNTVTHCFTGFANVLNFTGAPGLPEKNPHIIRRSWED